MRNRLSQPKPALRRLAPLLALAALAVGVLPAAAAGAESGTVVQNTQIGSAPATTWSLIATLDPTHVQAIRAPFPCTRSRPTAGHTPTRWSST